MTCPRCSGPMTVLLVTSVCDRCDPPRGAVAIESPAWVLRWASEHLVDHWLSEGHGVADRDPSLSEIAEDGLVPVCLRGSYVDLGDGLEEWCDGSEWRRVAIVDFGTYRAAVCRQTGEVLAVVQR